MQSIENKVCNRIYGHGKGWVFTNKDFSDLANAGTIDVSLHRLKDTGTIRRICRGVYDCPIYSEFLNTTLAPDIDKVAKAIARRSGWRIYPEGNVALNLLGLSNQVPGRIVYLSDGVNRSRIYKIGNFPLEIKKAPLKDINLQYGKSTLVVQALKALGNPYISDDVIEKLSSKFTKKEKKRILQDTSYVTGWIREAILKICNGGENE